MLLICTSFYSEYVYYHSSIMALSPKETSEWETNTAFPEDRGVRGLYHHSEWPQVADAVIEAHREAIYVSTAYWSAVSIDVWVLDMALRLDGLTGRRHGKAKAA
jgi:hypothetical protein